MEKKIKFVMLVVIRVRGAGKIPIKIDSTMKMMRLYKANNCVIVPNTPQYLGMIRRVKDYITWGEVDMDTIKKIIEKKGRLAGNKQLTNDYLLSKLKMNIEMFSKEFFSGAKGLSDVPGMKGFFRLNPPIGGYEREGIKKPYSLGGALGYRKENINELLRRMI